MSITVLNDDIETLEKVHSGRVDLRYHDGKWSVMVEVQGTDSDDPIVSIRLALERLIYSPSQDCLMDTDNNLVNEARRIIKDSFVEHPNFRDAYIAAMSRILMEEVGGTDFFTREKTACRILDMLF